MSTRSPTRTFRLFDIETKQGSTVVIFSSVRGYILDNTATETLDTITVSLQAVQSDPSIDGCLIDNRIAACLIVSLREPIKH
jgi:hypothetical protein